MDIVRRHVRRGSRVNIVFVALLAIRKRGDGEGRAAPWGILRLNETGEPLVGGEHVGIDGIGDFLRQTLLIFRRDAGRILLCRQQEGIGIDDALALRRNFLRQEAHGHELVHHAGAENFGDLGEDARNLVQARDVVFVTFDGIERHRQWQVGEIGMDAALLVDRHLVFLQAEVSHALPQHADQQIMGELVLIGEISRVDRLQALQEGFVGLMAALDGVERVVGEPVVVAVVAKRCRALREVAQIGFVLLVEKGILGGKAFGNGLGVPGQRRKRRWRAEAGRLW